MLAIHSTAPRRLARAFATAVDAGGVKVAAIDHGQPTASVTVLAKAGSRYQPAPGVAHALKNFAFKSTASRSALGTVREAELYGGVLSASLTREHIALTAEFLRGDEPFFIDVLTSFLTSAKYTRHELSEYVRPSLEADMHAAAADSAATALDLAHALAFRTGLGAPLLASPAHPVSADQIAAYAAAAFAPGNIALLGTGIAQDTLAGLAGAKLSGAGGAPLVTDATKYYGGETRVGAHGASALFIGFGTAGAPSAALSALAAHLAPAPSVKWSAPALPGVQSVLLPYSDAALFGLLVRPADGVDVKEAGRKAVEALKKAAGGVGADELKRAVGRAKFAAASAVEGREGLVHVLGGKLLAGSDASVESVVADIEKVTSSAITKAASDLLKSKPTYVAVGDIQSLPYADELGL